MWARHSAHPTDTHVVTSGTERSFHCHRSTLFPDNVLRSDRSQADDQTEVTLNSVFGLVKNHCWGKPQDKLGLYLLVQVATALPLRLFTQENADSFPIECQLGLAAGHRTLVAVTNTHLRAQATVLDLV